MVAHGGIGLGLCPIYAPFGIILPRAFSSVISSPDSELDQCCVAPHLIPSISNECLAPYSCPRRRREGCADASRRLRHRTPRRRSCAPCARLHREDHQRPAQLRHHKHQPQARGVHAGAQHSLAFVVVVGGAQVGGAQNLASAEEACTEDQQRAGLGEQGQGAAGAGGRGKGALARPGRRPGSPRRRCAPMR